ncbi:MAG: aminotransferase class V-fold PLP-dependent enzyme [Chitinophagales bacterium]|nr:aminotransferase class V-fold PLP-dependent enzyme [Chitinophagales bacterium]
MIYLDYNATTPVDERVLQAMLPYFNQQFGNAASKAHAFGWVAESAVKTSREQIAQLLNVEPGEIIFTSGATEAINMALFGVLQNYSSKGSHIITVATEHKAVLDTCLALEKRGTRVSYLPVDTEGRIDLAELESQIGYDTILICVMLANNETGVLQDIASIGTLAKKHGILFMSDVTQAVGKIPVDIQALNIDIAPLSAHKFYGPKGIGALFIRRKKPRVSLPPLIYGGGHERGLRSGTLNVPGIVGMGAAAGIVNEELDIDKQRIITLRDQLQWAFQSLPNTVINGSLNYRLPNTLNISFTGLNTPSILGKLSDKVAVSSGSACTSASLEPSYVLKAMGKDDRTALASIRFSVGRFTSETEIDSVITTVKRLVNS